MRDTSSTWLGRRAAVLGALAAAWALGCGGGDGGDHWDPRPAPGFQLIAGLGEAGRSARTQSVSARGLAVRGDRWAVVVQTAGTSDISGGLPGLAYFDPFTGDLVTPTSGTTGTSSFELMLSDDAGTTWRHVPLQFVEFEATGVPNDLMLVGDRIFTAIWRQTGLTGADWQRRLAEIDAATGRVRGILPDLRLPSGIVWELGDTLGFFSYGEGTAINQHYGYTIDPLTAELTNFGLFLGAGSCYAPNRFIPSSADHWYSMCLTDTSVCMSALHLDPAMPDSPHDVEACADVGRWPLEDFRGEPGFTPNLWLAGGDLLMLYDDEADGHVKATGFHRSGPEFGELIDPPLDLGPGELFQADGYAFRRRYADLVSIQAGTTVNDLQLVRLLPDELGGPTTLEIPNPCREARCDVDPVQGFLRVDRMVRLDREHYLATIQVSREYYGLGGVRLFLGVIDDPFADLTPPPPPGPEDPVEAALDAVCWGERLCTPWGEPSPLAAQAQVGACLARWTSVRGAPDAAYARFVGTDATDCAALALADPVGALDPNAVSCDAGAVCVDGGTAACLPTGPDVVDCGQANGGSCTLSPAGSGGCFADVVCTADSPDPYCDDAGRAVDCLAHVVDDCAARGMGCAVHTPDGALRPRADCTTPESPCAAAPAPGVSFCDGNQVYACTAEGAAYAHQDCARLGRPCDPSGGCYVAVGELPADLLGCAGDVVTWAAPDGLRTFDCGRLGARCVSGTEPGEGACAP